MTPDWFNKPMVWDGSRWLGWKDGQLTVWKVIMLLGQGEREHFVLDGYWLENEDSQIQKFVKEDKMYEMIAAKRLICIYEYTKDAWVKMSK